MLVTNTIDTYTQVTGIGNGDNYHLSCVLSLLRQKLQKHYGNDTIITSMASYSGTSSLLLVALNTTLDKSLFKTGSEVAAHAYEAMRVLCENKTKEVPYIEFSCLLLKELEGALQTNVTFSFY